MKFSVSRLLSDIRGYWRHFHELRRQTAGARAGHPEQPDDADNPLRVLYGNEATDRDIAEFSRRFGCRIVDGFGSSEFAVVVVREDGTPPGSIGKGWPGVAIYDPQTVTECATAEFDEHGALLNFDDAVGELVNTEGPGRFGLLHNDPDATAERLRHGNVLDR